MCEYLHAVVVVVVVVAVVVVVVVTVVVVVVVGRKVSRWKVISAIRVRTVIVNDLVSYRPRLVTIKI